MTYPIGIISDKVDKIEERLDAQDGILKEIQKTLQDTVKTSELPGATLISEPPTPSIPQGKEWKEDGEKRAEVETKPNTTIKPRVVGEEFEEINNLIAQDAVEVGADVVAEALLNDVCVKHGCREKVFIMEKGDFVRAQPFRLTDSQYQVVSKQTIKQILDTTAVDKIDWEAEEYDCDDIARKLVTRCVDLGINSVGRVMSWSGKHAFCIAVVQGEDTETSIEFVFIEPQTDEIITSLEGKYDLSNALIIIS